MVLAADFVDRSVVDYPRDRAGGPHRHGAAISFRGRRGQFRGRGDRPALPPPPLAQSTDRRGFDRAVPADRLSDGAWRRARGGALARAAAAGADVAILDRVPDAHQCLDRHVARRWLDQCRPDVLRVRARAAALHGHGAVHRHGLHLSAVHGAAGLRPAGEARPGVAGSRRRSRRLSVSGVSPRDTAAVSARNRSGRGAGLHPVCRRIRHPRVVGRTWSASCGTSSFRTATGRWRPRWHGCCWSCWWWCRLA